MVIRGQCQQLVTNGYIPMLNIHALAKAHPAIALFLSRSKLVYEKDCPTAATALDQDGNLTTFVGELVANAPLDVQVEVLKHELAHIVGRFWQRMEALPEPKPLNVAQLFNIAHDAAIHEAGCCDLAKVETILPPVTCAKLGVEPAPAEEIYQELLKKSDKVTVSCGRADFIDQIVKDGKALDPIEHPISEKLSEAFQSALSNHFYGGKQQSHGRTLTGTLPPTPEWAKQLYKYMEELMGEERLPERSWVRGPSRRHELLPGWPRVQPSHSAVLMLDASGSMSDNVLLQAVAAAQSVGLSVTVRVWSTFTSAPLPPDPATIRGEIERHGGGTTARHCAQVIEHEKCVIWISDTESADGLPGERKGWVWVVTNGGEPIFTRSPHAN